MQMINTRVRIEIQFYNLKQYLNLMSARKIYGLEYIGRRELCSGVNI